jgi:hypothetical protein
MTEESINATDDIAVPAKAVFDILADPTTHSAIDGTGWVRESLDGVRLTEPGQIFRMAMYHENHPAKSYEMANEVQVYEPPHAIAWRPGQAGEDGNLEIGGWVWRYDLMPVSESETTVTLSYDWSAVPQYIRQQIQFPPFDLEHLKNSLRHLAELAERARL